MNKENEIVWSEDEIKELAKDYAELVEREFEEESGEEWFFDIFDMMERKLIDKGVNPEILKYDPETPFNLALDQVTGWRKELYEDIMYEFDQNVADENEIEFLEAERIEKEENQRKMDEEYEMREVYRRILDGTDNEEMENNPKYKKLYEYYKEIKNENT